MEPIISPVFIYLLSIVDNISIIFKIGIGFSICAMVFFLLLLIEIRSDEDWIKWKKCMRNIIIGLITCSVIVIFIPNKETLIAMYATKYITVNNIKSGKEIVIDTIKEVVDAINKGEK